MKIEVDEINYPILSQWNREVLEERVLSIARSLGIDTEDDAALQTIVSNLETDLEMET